MNFYFKFFLLWQSASTLASQQGCKLPLIRIKRPSSIAQEGQSPAGDGSTAIQVLDRNDYTYIVNVSVGAQSFPLTLDTGSSDLWVISNECKSADCSNVARYSQSFSTNLSITQMPFHTDYISGSVSGLVAAETVSLGPYQLISQVFGLANCTEGISFSEEGNSGILGLAFPSEMSMPGMTVLQSIFTALPDPYFTITLGSKLNVNSSSSFTLGQIDDLYANDLSDFFTIPVSKAGANDYTYWKISLLYITINSTRISLSPSSVQGVQHSQIAVLDTGTTLALGPTRDVETFWASLGSAARNDPITGMWEVRCEKAIMVGFALGQEDSYREFVLDPADVSWENDASNNGWCLGGIQANDEVDSGDWLLGDVFLRNVYSLYHAANSSNGPWIGLLSITNNASALTAFRQSRGPDLDSSTPPAVQIQSAAVSPEVRYKLLYGTSTLCGFIGGVVLTSLFRARHGLWYAFRKQKQK
ncbi:aspartic peptidase domain-containing protein [Lentinula detonsa]|uniref:Aspartic peptidase domain-containing protein n=1 Tax=Lentinula detonsa TaxID=2804962 RepID=A0AA38PVY1_9AGAR|nr:aspartic peptidase domain-containing protein [Lentinula detonsa]